MTIELTVCQALMPALVMLCLVARKIATLADQVRTDRARLRAEAAHWRAELDRHSTARPDRARKP
jgi:hypothetical protein